MLKCNSCRGDRGSGSEESLYHLNRARWYSPTIGRFTSVDPWSGNTNNPISLHRYLYGNASPITFSDPSGQTTTLEVMATISIFSIFCNNCKLYLISNFMILLSFGSN